MRTRLAIGAAAVAVGWGLKEHAAMLLATGEDWRLVHVLGISLTGIGCFALVAGVASWIARARGEEDWLDEVDAALGADAATRERASGTTLRVRRHRRRRERAARLAAEGGPRNESADA